MNPDTSMFDGVRPINFSQKVNSKGSAPTPILSEKGESDRKGKTSLKSIMSVKRV